MTTTDPTAGPQIVSGDYDEAAAHHDALLRQVEQARAENARLRSQLAEARDALARVAKTLGWDVRPEQVPSGIPDLAIAVQQLRHERDQAAEALVQAETERDQALAEIHRLERAAHEQGADLWIAEDRLDWLRKRVRLAMDLLCSPTVPHEPGPDVPGAYGILSHALATTAPETAPESPQTDEQAQVRGESHTEPQTGSQGPLDLDAIRAAWLRVCGSCDAGYPTNCTCPPGDPRSVITALVAEVDRLRTEVKQLSAEREWLADRARTIDIAEAIIAAHGRLRAKVKHLGARVREWEAVLREIDRLRAALNSQEGSR